MPAPAHNAATVTATALWHEAAGARHFLICHPDRRARADALASLLTAVNGLPDVTVWADHRTLDSVKQPDDLSVGYFAAAARSTAEVLGLAAELADARASVLEGTNRWLFKPARQSRLILVLADLTAPWSAGLSRTRPALDRLLARGRRAAMPVAVAVDPGTTPRNLLQSLAQTCQSWPMEPQAA
jgi:hypothetical protein